MILYEHHIRDIWISRREDGDFVPHAHHNLELLVCLSGTLGAVCREEKRILKPGELMVAFSNDIHAYHFSGGGEGVMMIVNPQVLPLLSWRLGEGRYGNFPRGDYSREARALLEEAQGDCCREVLVGYLYVLLGTAFKTLPYTRERDQLSPDLFAQVMEYVSGHYMEPMSLKGLAKTFGVDASRLSRMFSQRLSYGFVKYLHLLRVEHAKVLLTSTRLKMDEIMASSGFADQKTFNRVFREIMGMTPREYRRGK